MVTFLMGFVIGFLGDVSAKNRCSFKRIDGRLLTHTLLQEESLREPLVLTSAFPWRKDIASKDVFLQLFGNHTLSVGSDREGRALAGVAIGRVPTKVREWVDGSFLEDGVEKYAFVWLHMADQRSLGMDILKRYGTPASLQNWLTLKRFLVLGARSNSKGLALHQHSASYVQLMSGEKQWFVFSPLERIPIQPFVHHPPELLTKTPGVRACLQKASEVVVVPNGWWHTTVDQKDWTVGFGGQAWALDGSLSSWSGAQDNGHANYLVAIGSLAGLNLSLPAEKLVAPLHVAALSGHTALVDVLLSRRVDANLASGLDGRRPIHEAASEGHSQVLGLLLSHRTGIDVKDMKNNEPLHAASATGHASVAEVLIRNGADLHAVDGQHDEPIHVGAFFGHFDIVKVLVAQRVDVNIASGLGIYPLHKAVHQGHRKVSSLLLHSRAQASAKDRNAMTPLQLATAVRGEKFATFLRARMKDRREL